MMMMTMMMKDLSCHDFLVIVLGVWIFVEKDGMGWDGIEILGCEKRRSKQLGFAKSSIHLSFTFYFPS